MTYDDTQLSEVLSEFARTMVTNFPIQSIMDRLVERIVDIMPISSAGVTLISAEHGPRYIAASDQAAMRYEQLQSELKEGPCLLAYETGRHVAVPDLATELRFPHFTPNALEAGLRAVFTFPLHDGNRRLGALDLYRETVGAMNDQSLNAARTLADITSAYLHNAAARDDLEDLARQTRYAAVHDALTGLPNRVLLIDRVAQALLRNRSSGQASALLYIDLDRFKLVNDSYGHGAGDTLLVAVAHRLTQQLRPDDTMARLAGDEFVILCDDVDSRDSAARIVTRLQSALERPFLLAGREILVGASIGMAYADPLYLDTPERLLHAADMAMYAAKSTGARQQQVFEPAIEDGRLAELERDLHEALARDEFHLEYQPIVDTVDGRITGHEALLRWTHPTRGPIPPNTLIPLAEQSGLIIEIGRWVLQRAWSDARRWQRRFGNSLTMSVNVSAYQLMSAAFADTVATVLRTTDIDPALLTLEITESVFVRDSARALMVLGDLKDLGVNIALDDFGTGYSSLGYLRRFPVDIVKIDRTFIADLGSESANDIIVGAVIRLAHDLKMTVVAEGIETKRQHRDIAALGCDSCQGFYFARPMPAALVEAGLSGRGKGNRPRLPTGGAQVDRDGN